MEFMFIDRAPRFKRSSAAAAFRSDEVKTHCLDQQRGAVTLDVYLGTAFKTPTLFTAVEVLDGSIQSPLELTITSR